MSSGKWWPFCLRLNVLIQPPANQKNGGPLAAVLTEKLTGKALQDGTILRNQTGDGRELNEEPQIERRLRIAAAARASQNTLQAVREHSSIPSISIYDKSHTWRWSQRYHSRVNISKITSKLSCV